jgi:hypothetical protein
LVGFLRIGIRNRCFHVAAEAQTCASVAGTDIAGWWQGEGEGVDIVNAETW